METITPSKVKITEDQLLIDKPVDLPLVSKQGGPRFLEDLIEAKKTRQEKDKAQRLLFFFIGLTLSLGAVITAFEWRWSEQEALVDLGEVETVMEVLSEIPPTEQPPPPPPQMAPQVITEIANTEVIEKQLDVTIDVEATEEMVVEEVVIEPFEEVEQEVVEAVFHIVEHYPEPIGGFAAFYAFVGENLNYPNTAIKQGVEGKVFVQFVVEKDGSLSNFKVVKGIGPDCDAEAIRVLSLAPDWQPGKQRGASVRVYKTIPIVFMLKRKS